jgi:hypothetical protein
MQEGHSTMEDPNQGKRLAIAIPSALLLGLSGFFASSIALHPDGTHGPVLAIDGVRTAILAVTALAIVFFAARPLNPDPRIAQAVMLAGAVLATVLGLEGIITPSADAGRVPGASPYMQILAAVGLLTLRWRKGLWPTSRWMLEAQQAAAQRRISRRGKRE